MPTCLNCRHEFGLHEAPGAAGVTAEGDFIGRCPKCKSIVGTKGNFPTARYSDVQVENIVCGLELAGDNLSRRVLDLMIYKMIIKNLENVAGAKQWQS